MFKHSEAYETQLGNRDRNCDTHSDVVLGEEHTDDDRRQFGRGRAGRHKSSTGDVRR